MYSPPGIANRSLSYSRAYSLFLSLFSLSLFLFLHFFKDILQICCFILNNILLTDDIEVILEKFYTQVRFIKLSSKSI